MTSSVPAVEVGDWLDYAVEGYHYFPAGCGICFVNSRSSAVIDWLARGHFARGEEEENKDIGGESQHISYSYSNHSTKFTHPNTICRSFFYFAFGNL